MKIAFFTESYRPVTNGVSRSVDIMVETLRQQGHQTIVYAPRARGFVDTDPGVRRFPSYYFPRFPEYPLAVPFSLSIFREFAHEKFDLVHIQTPWALGMCGLALARRHGIPVLAHMHTLYVEYAHYWPFFPVRVTRQVVQWFTRWYYNKPDAVVAPSPSVRELLLDYGVRRPIHVVPTGVRLTKPMERQEARLVFGLPAGGKVLLYTGRLALEKNLGLLLEAFYQIHEALPGTRLLVLGGGPAEETFRQLAAAVGLQDAILLAGIRPHQDVMAACAAADLFLFPSQTDTQALAVLEAMSCGVPPVVVDATGPAEFLQDGVSGRVVPADPAAMARAALSLLTNPAEHQRLSAGAFDCARTFSVEACTETLLEVYRSILPASQDPRPARS